MHTRHALVSRRGEVDRLEAEKHQLEQRVTASSSTASLALEARRLALVKPGERLFIVKGIGAWRRAHRTLAGDG